MKTRSQGNADSDEDTATHTMESAGAGEHGREDARAGSATAASPGGARAPSLHPEQLLSTLLELMNSMQSSTTGGFRASTPVPPGTNTSMNGSNATNHHANFTRCTARFDGAARDVDRLEAFVDAVTTFKECAGVSDDHALRGLPMLLEGEAAVWWRGVKSSVSSWDDAMARLRAMYGVSDPPYKLFRKIFAKEQQESERSEVFICGLRALIAKLPYKLDEKVQLDMCYGLLNRRIKKRVPRDTVNSLDDLVCKTRIAEDLYSESALGPKKDSIAKTASPSNVAATPRSVASGGSGANGPRNDKTRDRPRCSFCKFFGHLSSDCRKRENDSTNNVGGSTRSSSVRCYGCGKVGVIRSKCDVCNASTSTKKGTDCNNSPGTCFSTFEVIETRSNKMRNDNKRNDIKTIDIRTIENRTIENTTIDNRTIDNRTIDSFREYNDDEISDTSCVTDYGDHEFNSSEISSLVSAFVDNRGNSAKTNLPEAGTPVNVTQPIVNVSVFGKHGVAIVDTGATHSIASPSLYRILLDSGICFEETHRLIRLADGTRSNKTMLQAVVPVTIGSREIICDFFVLPGDDTKTLLGIEFLARAGIVLDVARSKWMFMDDLRHEHDFVDPHTIRSADNDLMSAEAVELGLRPDEGTMLTSGQTDALNNFIKSRAPQFAHEGTATEFAAHHIKVRPDQEPIASPPYRLSQHKKEALRGELDKLLRSDVIEECESPWAANVVLVPKKDGTVRLCIDYRKLNQVTEADRYPLPRMEDVLHAAKASEYMTTLDLRSGYYQVRVAEEDKDKTAFTTPLGTYRFKRMPMGLRNSGATFQRLMDRFRSNLKGIELHAYLDDVIVLSPGPFERHLADLETVFDRLKMYNLRVNRDKSHFARESVKFLGHIITPGGIQVDPEKTAAVESMAIPQNVKQLKSFLQTSSWFRRFINNYAEVARPLTGLLKKNSVWRWGADQQKAFEDIKKLLVTAPILRQADETKPFVLCTDSSGYCLGAVLMQGEGPDERPIEYASRLLNSAERNYTTTEREALAVVWALGKFRGYVENARIIVRTDHQPLRWLMSQRSPSGRLARWALTLQEFDLDITYTPGRTNVIADTLSRPVCAEEPDCDVHYTTVDLPRRSTGDIRENQLKDPEIRKIVEDLESDEPSKGRPWSDRGYTISDGVLYRYSLEADEEEEACLVVPDHERKQVMAELHDAPTAGHFGVERTLNRVRGRYYWPGMRKFVTEYIKECVPCQRYKASNLKPAGLLQTPAVARRWEVVSVDLFGPLVETSRKHRWILIVEDVCSRWVELFPLESATSVECARVLVNEVFLRYGVPRRLISDNGVQFVSDVMQQACHVMGITQVLTPYYHPQANPIERKNRDLKPQLAILVGQDHATWDLHLAAVRFAMNSAVTASTGFTPAYLTFGRELRAPSDSLTDMRGILDADNFVPSITPYLKRLSETLDEARDTHEKAQESQKKYADQSRRNTPEFKVGDLVLLKTQGPNDAGRGQSAKFIPRRDGPYKVSKIASPTSYELENVQTGTSVGRYHVSHLTPFVGEVEPPIREKRKRGRPRRYNC